MIKKVEEVLIRDQLEAIYNEAKVLLRDEKHQGEEQREKKTSENISTNIFFFANRLDLALLFKLVSRVPNATTDLKKIVENHIYQMGIEAIDRVSGTAINVKTSRRHFSFRYVRKIHLGSENLRRNYSRHSFEVF